MTLFQDLKSTYLRLWRVRTPIRQYASCVLVDVDDTLPSIFSSDIAAITLHKGARIGINAGN